MLEFDTVQLSTGAVVPKFGRDHQLTISFGKFVSERMDESNEVWDEGYLSFDRPMDDDVDNLEISVLDAKVGHKNYTCLQIVANEATKEPTPKKKKATITRRAVRTGSSTGKNYQNVRTREPNEYENQNQNDNGSKKTKTGGPGNFLALGAAAANYFSSAHDTASTFGSGLQHPSDGDAMVEEENLLGPIL